MAIQKTLAEVARAVLFEAAVKAGSGTTFRTTIEDLYPEINSAYVEQQEESIAREHSFYAIEGTLAPLPVARAGTSENYSLVDWPLGTHDIVRVDVLVNGSWDKLDPVEWENLRDVVPRQASASSARPTKYSARQFASVAGATAAAGKIALAPFCRSGQYKLSTLPVWTPITSLTDVFIFPSESAFRWTVWNVVARIACRDIRGVTKARYDISVKERGDCASRMGRSRTAPTGGTIRRSPRRWG